MDNKEEQECCCLSSSGSGDESVYSAIESDDRQHQVSPEHCHLLLVVITPLLRRCSPQRLREGTS